MSLTKKYIFNPNYILKSDIKRIILTNADSKNILDKQIETDFVSILHPIQAMLFAFFNGKDTLETVLDKLSTFFEKPRKTFEELVPMYIENKESFEIEYEGSTFFIPKNVIIENKNRNERNYSINELVINSELDLNTKRLYKPLGATFIINTKCVTNCTYCYADRQTSYEGLTLERIKKIIREASSIGMRDFDISGGEFFLHKNWVNILEELINNGFQPYISTKKPINEEDVKILKSIGIKRLQISLDSVNPQILTTTLKVKSDYFTSLKSTLFLLNKHKIPVRINTILTKLTANKQNISSLLSNLLPFDNIELINISPAGHSLYKGEENYLSNRIDATKLEELESFVNNEFIRKKNDVTISFNDYEKKTNYQNKIQLQQTIFDRRATCGGNFFYFIILPDGKVTVCEELYWNPNFILGDLKKQSIEEIWNSKKSLDLYNLAQDKLQDSSACSVCRDFTTCHQQQGVCWRNVQIAYGKGNWDYPDPKCPMAPKPKNVFYVE